MLEYFGAGFLAWMILLFWIEVGHVLYSKSIYVSSAHAREVMSNIIYGVGVFSLGYICLRIWRLT